MGELDSTFDLSQGLRLRLHPRVAIDPLEPQRDRFEPYDAYVEYAPGAWTYWPASSSRTGRRWRCSVPPTSRAVATSSGTSRSGKLGELMVRPASPAGGRLGPAAHHLSLRSPLVPTHTAAAKP
jgi:hypothetical protein